MLIFSGQFVTYGNQVESLFQYLVAFLSLEDFLCHTFQYQKHAYCGLGQGQSVFLFHIKHLSVVCPLVAGPSDQRKLHLAMSIYFAALIYNVSLNYKKRFENAREIFIKYYIYRYMNNFYDIFFHSNPILSVLVVLVFDGFNRISWGDFLHIKNCYVIGLFAPFTVFLVHFSEVLVCTGIYMTKPLLKTYEYASLLR